MRWFHTHFIFIALICAVSQAHNEGGNVALELLPRGRPFRLTFADPREIRMVLLFEGDSRLHAMVGNYFSIFALRPTDASWDFHVGLEGAGFFSLRQAQQRFPLESTDGLLGAYAEAKQKAWAVQLRYTHLSAHLSDGINQNPIAYSRESTNFRIGFLPRDDLFLYAGASAIVHSIPTVRPWAFQCGGSFFVPWSSGKLAPFSAVDLKWKQESPFNPSFTLQLGIALNNPPESYRSFRFFYAYFTGADPRGQFFERSATSHSIGVEMQI